MHYSTALIQLPLVRECQGQRIVSPADAYRLCADLADLAQESFQLLTLNAKNCLIDRHMITLGLVDSSLVHSREVFRAALSDCASTVLLIHNHPSGDTTPSGEDIRITKQLIEVGRIVDIKVMDHVVIGRATEPGRPEFLSMRESGVVMFA